MVPGELLISLLCMTDGIYACVLTRIVLVVKLRRFAPRWVDRAGVILYLNGVSIQHVVTIHMSTWMLASTKSCN